MERLNIWTKLSQAQKEEHGPRLRAYFPNTETIDDPDWVDPEDGTEAPQIQKYTDDEWLDIKTWKILASCSRKGQIMIDASDNMVVHKIE
jgi:hypothetical protein